MFHVFCVFFVLVSFHVLVRDFWSFYDLFVISPSVVLLFLHHPPFCVVLFSPSSAKVVVLSPPSLGWMLFPLILLGDAAAFCWLSDRLGWKIKEIGKSKTPDSGVVGYFLPSLVRCVLLLGSFVLVFVMTLARVSHLLGDAAFPPGSFVWCCSLPPPPSGGAVFHLLWLVFRSPFLSVSGAALGGPTFQSFFCVVVPLLRWCWFILPPCGGADRNLPQSPWDGVVVSFSEFEYNSNNGTKIYR